MNRSSLPLTCLVTLLLLPWSAAAAPAQDPTLWPEGQRTFLQDGPGWLLSAEERAELLALDEGGRSSFINSFLAQDPLPETPANELAEGIRRRLLLARSLFLSPKDTRYRLLFLAGPPAERLEVDCGATYHPLEVWSFRPGSSFARRALALQAQVLTAAESELDVKEKRWFSGWEDGPRLVVYRTGPASPFHLWDPFETKRALYTDEMEYLLEQWEELVGVGRRRAAGGIKRIDLQACDEAPEVDAATGVEALRGFKPGRPTRSAVYSFLEPPVDLAAWAREAAATPLPEPGPELAVEPLQFFFPDSRDQRILTRLLLPLLPGADVQVSEEGKLDLIVEGVLEQGDTIFEGFRVRFEPEPAAEKPLALSIDRALRPGEVFVARVRVKDQLGGGTAYAAGAFEVPPEPRTDEALTSYEQVEALGADLAREASVGRDSLILAPPAPGEVILGLWRAQALVTGDRIEKVTFLVDGEAQLTRTRPPFSAEVRLAKYPTEQVIRAEGYAAADELVAADEVVVNQPRGSFRVRILEPRRGAAVAGEVEARAEVVVPDDERVERVELRVNDELIATLVEPPWRARVPVPEGGEVAYLSVTAVLESGLQAEDVRFLNAPRYLEELEVNLVELYTTVTDRSGRLVRDLEAGDFEILEEGRPQEIAKFELVEDLPLTVGIAIDTSGSMSSSLIEAQRAGRAFLESLVTQRDRCFVVGFSGKPALLMPPTDDLDGCVSGLEGLRAAGLTALHDAVVTSLYYMRELRGQRALVLLSDGEDSASAISYADALEFARRSGAAIFPIGLGVGALDLGIRDKLKELAQETGGRYFFVKSADELAGVYEEIEDELRSRYLLAFNSGQGAGEGTFREVEVKVKRRGLKARTIRGYYHP